MGFTPEQQAQTAAAAAAASTAAATPATSKCFQLIQQYSLQHNSSCLKPIAHLRAGITLVRSGVRV
jgi:hypothetical protein